MDGEEIVCTPLHPFYVLSADEKRNTVRYEGAKKGKWIAAKELKISDKLLLANGKYAIIDSIEVELLESPETTYNFEVEDFHTYFVSDSNVLVHNSCTKDYKRLDEKKFMKDNNMDSEQFHKFKKNTLKKSEYPIKQYGKNPDLWINKTAKQLAFKSRINPKLPLFETNLYLDNYIIRW